MNKFNLHFLVIAAVLICGLVSCDNPQTPQEEKEPTLSIEFLKNRKIALETRVSTDNSSRDTTTYKYDSQKRLINKRMIQYTYNEGILRYVTIREESYDYEGLKQTIRKYDADYTYKDGVIDENKTRENTYVYGVMTYTDTTFSKVESYTRESDNYVCTYKYDDLGRSLGTDETYRGSDYSGNKCDFHIVTNRLYSGKVCTWKSDTYKDNVLYEVYEGTVKYADDECEYQIEHNREYTMYPPKEDYSSETRYNNRKIKTEQTFTYDEYFRMTSNVSKRYNVSGYADKLEYRYSYTGKNARVEYLIDDELKIVSEVTYVDL